MVGGIGVGLVAWAKRYMTPPEPDVEPRGRIASTEEEIEEFKADFDVGEYELERRSLLTKLLVGAVGGDGSRRADPAQVARARARRELHA